MHNGTSWRSALCTYSPHVWTDVCPLHRSCSPACDVTASSHSCDCTSFPGQPAGESGDFSGRLRLQSCHHLPGTTARTQFSNLFREGLDASCKQERTYVAKAFQLGSILNNRLKIWKPKRKLRSENFSFLCSLNMTAVVMCSLPQKMEVPTLHLWMGPYLEIGFYMQMESS